MFILKECFLPNLATINWVGIFLKEELTLRKTTDDNRHKKMTRAHINNQSSYNKIPLLQMHFNCVTPLSWIISSCRNLTLISFIPEHQHIWFLICLLTFIENQWLVSKEIVIIGSWHVKPLIYIISSCRLWSWIIFILLMMSYIHIKYLHNLLSSSKSVELTIFYNVKPFIWMASKY